MAKDYSITKYFGSNLAELLSEKIRAVYSEFERDCYINAIASTCEGKSYTKRIELHAEYLQLFLPEEYEKAINILISILDEENPNETGMFTNYYWVLPIGKFVELFGLEHYDISIHAISEITKRNTGEYAIRPFIRKYPEKTIEVMNSWAESDNFHLRRLASEGLRPKLPWSGKLETFIDEPWPVFEILNKLKEDPIKFVQKSVANHVSDYLKVNEKAASQLLDSWADSNNKHTQWIMKHATRKLKVLQE